MTVFLPDVVAGKFAWALLWPRQSRFAWLDDDNASVEHDFMLGALWPRRVRFLREKEKWVAAVPFGLDPWRVRHAIFRFPHGVNSAVTDGRSPGWDGHSRGEMKRWLRLEGGLSWAQSLYAPAFQFGLAGFLRGGSLCARGGFGHLRALPVGRGTAIEANRSVRGGKFGKHSDGVLGPGSTRDVLKMNGVSMTE